MAQKPTIELTLRERIEHALTGEIPESARARQTVADKEMSEEEESKKVAHWGKEIELAERFLKDFHTDSNEAVNAFIDHSNESLPDHPKFKLNLFHANITTLTSIMFARVPKVEADRRFADPSDDVARVAATIITRILQNDMNDPDDKYMDVLRQALQDRLVPGLGVARIRYCMEEKEAPEEGVEYGAENPVPTVKSDEWCDMEYVHWRDVLWSPCRTPAELRWKAYRVYMTKEEVLRRFGKDVAELVPYATRGPSLDPDEEASTEITSHSDAAQAEVWEIWDKSSRCVYWYVKGFSKFLDKKEDPLGLEGFWPDPQWMTANVSTRKYLPKADYQLSRDLYDEISELECRIAMLTQACKVVGVYPASAEEVKRIMTEGVENQLIPIENWAMFVDKGGLKGQIEYFPVREVAETIQILGQQQALRIQQLYQVTGMSDIIRGQAVTSGVTATEQRIKAQFASTRMQSLQEEFAKFASELLNLKVQLIRRLYDPDRIKQLSNIMSTADAELADQAIALIKDERSFNCRVKVTSESMAQVDYEGIKLERSEFMQSVAAFLGNVGPILEQIPSAAPFMLELLKFNLAGMRSSNEMEGIIDRAVAAMIQQEQQKASQPPEPSPEEKAEQIKIQGQMQIEQVKAQGDAQARAAEFQLKQQEMAAQLQMQREELNLKMEQMREEHRMQMMRLIMELQGMRMELGLKREEQQIKLEGAQAEQAIKIQSAAQESEIREDEADREAEQSEREFEQSERHAEAAARREARDANKSKTRD